MSIERVIKIFAAHAGHEPAGHDQFAQFAQLAQMIRPMPGYAAALCCEGREGREGWERTTFYCSKSDNQEAGRIT